MGRVMKFQIGYGSHLPVLSRALSATNGDVLEMGAGLFSTPYLHWMCSAQHRKLVTYENQPGIYEQMRSCENEWHRVILIENWDLAEIEQPWDVALIDHHPAERRIVDVRRLAYCARYIVCHDTYWKQDKHYHYKEIFPLFRYRYDYAEYKPGVTSVLSNLVDLAEFHV